MNGDLPLASDEAHAMLYALLAEAYDELEPDEGGADEDPAPPSCDS